MLMCKYFLIYSAEDEVTTSAE